VTVKPLALMRWLVRLLCPPGGVVLDPFAGSGTTVEACIDEGMRVIGIEREAEYQPHIQVRVDRALARITPAAASQPEPTLFDLLDERSTA
jgi:DNA modification methylase